MSATPPYRRVCIGRHKHLRAKPTNVLCTSVRASNYGGGGGDGHWSDRLVIRSVMVNAPGAQPPLKRGGPTRCGGGGQTQRDRFLCLGMGLLLYTFFFFFSSFPVSLYVRYLLCSPVRHTSPFDSTKNKNPHCRLQDSPSVPGNYSYLPRRLSRSARARTHTRICTHSP